MLTGISIPPPSPWIIRNTIMEVMFHDMLQSSDPIVKTARARIYILFEPKRSVR